MSRRETRQQIIEACAPIFNSKGYLHVSVTDMEAAAGKSKAVLYGYFENKQQMANIILDHNLDQKIQTICELAVKRTTLKGKLFAHIDIHRPQYSGLLVSGGCPIQNAATEADDTNEDLRALAEQALLRWQKEFASLILQGINDKKISAEVNAEDFSWEIISLIEGAVLVGRATKNSDLCAQILDMAAGRIAQIL